MAGAAAAASSPARPSARCSISQGDGAAPVFSGNPVLSGEFAAFALRYDNQPGRREFTFGYDGGSGALVFARSDVPTKLYITPAANQLQISAVPPAPLVFAGDASIIFTPAGGGGAGLIQFGRRFFDSNPACGAEVQCWPTTAQETPALAVMQPGGAAARWGIHPDGSMFLTEAAAGAAPPANGARIWLEDNGAGKSRLMVQFATGAPVVIATEP